MDCTCSQGEHILLSLQQSLGTAEHNERTVKHATWHVILEHSSSTAEHHICSRRAQGFSHRELTGAASSNMIAHLCHKWRKGQETLGA